MSLADTSAQMEEILVEGYRRMSAQEKLEQVGQLTRAVQTLALLDLRRKYPEADHRELQLRLAARWLQPDLMHHLLGWDPREEDGAC